MSRPRIQLIIFFCEMKKMMNRESETVGDEKNTYKIPSIVKPACLVASSDRPLIVRTLISLGNGQKIYTHTQDAKRVDLHSCAAASTIKMVSLRLSPVLAPATD